MLLFYALFVLIGMTVFGFLLFGIGALFNLPAVALGGFWFLAPLFYLLMPVLAIFEAVTHNGRFTWGGYLGALWEGWKGLTEELLSGSNLI